MDAISAQLDDNNNLIKKRTKTNKNLKKIKFFEKIEIKDLSFKFPEKKLLIKNLNFSINKNSFIGIKGNSGSGKSTLLNIISGLIKPMKGGIFVDGIDIFENLEEWQKRLGYVSQSVFLIDASIKKNIAFGLDESEIDHNKLNLAIKNSGLVNYIQSLKDKAKTIDPNKGIVYTGNPKILKEVCPSVFGTIKPVGYCMIGQK